MTSTCSSLPSTRIQTRPSRTVRSLPSSSGKPSSEATKAWSNAVSESVPGLSTTTRGSSTAPGAASTRASRIAWKNGVSRCRLASLIDLRHHPRHHTTVLHGVTRAGGRLGPIGDHLPPAAAVPAEISRHQEKPLAGQRIACRPTAAGTRHDQEWLRAEDAAGTAAAGRRTGRRGSRPAAQLAAPGRPRARPTRDRRG